MVSIRNDRALRSVGHFRTAALSSYETGPPRIGRTVTGNEDVHDRRYGVTLFVKAGGTCAQFYQGQHRIDSGSRRFCHAAKFLDRTHKCIYFHWPARVQVLQH